jgi:hypothetical protein
VVGSWVEAVGLEVEGNEVGALLPGATAGARVLGNEAVEGEVTGALEVGSDVLGTVVGDVLGVAIVGVTVGVVVGVTVGVIVGVTVGLVVGVTVGAAVGAEMTQKIRVRAVSISVMLVYSVYQRCSSASPIYSSYRGLRGHRCYLGSRRYTE